MSDQNQTPATNDWPPPAPETAVTSEVELLSAATPTASPEVPYGGAASPQVPYGAAPTTVPSAPPAAYGQPPVPAPAVPQPMRRAPVNYQPNEAGWWLATDGLWYPPETGPGAAPQETAPAMISHAEQGSQNVVVNVTAPPSYGPNAPFVTGPPKSRVVAGLLQIFFGYLGIGRFYLGHGGLGAAQLLVTLFTCGIGGLWGLIDGIYILCGGVKTDSRGVPLT